jgi:L-threonylcarbamoyladenylate synthase
MQHSQRRRLTGEARLQLGSRPPSQGQELEGHCHLALTVHGAVDHRHTPGTDLAQVERVAFLTPLARRLAEAFWPGPLTLVLPARPGLPPPLLGGRGSVGVRVTSSPIAAALARAAGGPIVATSANASGAAPATSAAELDPALRRRLDLVLDGGPSPGGLPSTVVLVDGDQLTLVRTGATPFDALEALRGGGA